MDGFSNFPEKKIRRGKSAFSVSLRLRARPRPVRPEDCAMEVEKPAAGALCSGQRRLVELSTTRRIMPGWGGLDGHRRLPCSRIGVAPVEKRFPTERAKGWRGAPASPPDSQCNSNVLQPFKLDS